MALRILLVDDHALVRQGIRLIIEEDEHLQVIGEAHSGESAIDFVKLHQPDVVLMDVNMPGGMDGIKAAKKILEENPLTRILMLTMYDDEPLIEQMLLAGVVGVIFKHDPSTEIIKAIYATEQERPFLSDRISSEARKRILDHLDHPDEVITPLLTPRETEVLGLIAYGYTNREIAQRLQISVKTVEAHRSHIVERIGAETKADLIHYALNHHLIAFFVD